MGPHHRDGHATVAGVGDGVGCAAKSPRRLSIPNSNQEVTAIHDRLASGEVRFRGGLHKRQPFNAAIRGPLQFGMARSIDPIYPVDHAITRVTQTTQADIDRGESTEMGGKWTVPYALYRVELHYAGERGKQTGVTRDDLNMLYTTLLNMFDHDRTATRGIMASRALYVFSHSNSFGNAPAQALLERVHIERISTEVPRTFGDYKVTLNDSDLPTGVTLARLLG